MMLTEAKRIMEDIERHNAKCFIVGGFVRDMMLGIECKDIDIEVFGISFNDLVSILEKHGDVSLHGQKFVRANLKNSIGEFDFTLPRRDNKNGIGHKGFEIEVDHTMTLDQASLRRDFTFNSISMDINGNIFDPFNGRKDLEDRRIKATSKFFKDDPLRVLRGMQFVARFEITKFDPNTINMCHHLKDEFHTLPKDRIFEEFEKLLMKGRKPSIGLDWLNHTGWIEFWKELANLRGLPQDKEWHPEGDVFEHTKLVLDEMAFICRRENITGERRFILMLAALCHDFGKVNTTIFENGRITSKRHNITGLPLANEFMESIRVKEKTRKKVLPLIKDHLALINKIGIRGIRKLSVRLDPMTIEDLVFLTEADHNGRHPLPKIKDSRLTKVLELAEKANVKTEKPKPLLTGKDLINLGLTPNPEFGKILKESFKTQLDRGWTKKEQAIEWFKNKGAMK